MNVDPAKQKGPNRFRQMVGIDATDDGFCCRAAVEWRCSAGHTSAMMHGVHIFTRYEQEENQFTNGLVGLLALSAAEGPGYVNAFLAENVGIPCEGGRTSCCVLEGIEGTADAELRGTGIPRQSPNLPADVARIQPKAQECPMHCHPRRSLCCA